MPTVEEIMEDLINLLNVKSRGSPTMILNQLILLENQLTSQLDDIQDELDLRMVYKGNFDATAGYPTPTGLSQGWYYVCNVAGTIGGTVYDVGDWAVYNGTTWDKVEGAVNIENTYFCDTESEINSALSSIGANRGEIIITGNVNLSATINVNGGGSYIIRGQGDNSIVDCGGDRAAFNITSAVSCVLRDFKIDARDFTTISTNAITVNEGSDYPVRIDNINILGDGTNGYGIVLSSDNCIVKQCYFEALRNGLNIAGNYNAAYGNRYYSNASLGKGIYITGEYNIVSGNNMDCRTVAQFGININTGNYNTISNNTCINAFDDAIYVQGSDYNTVTDNICLNSTQGINIDNSDNNIFTGNLCSGNSSYGIFIPTSTSNNNVVKNNKCVGNGTSEYDDSGTNTKLEVDAFNRAEIEDITTNVGGSAIINLPNGTISISSAIDINGGGSYIIQGQGDNTVLSHAGGGEWQIFNITSAKSVIIRNLKIDYTNYPYTTMGAITVNEASDNPVNIENCRFVASGWAGYGIRITSDNVHVSGCYFDTGFDGQIVITGNHNRIIGNHFYDARNTGVNIDGGDYNVVEGNTFNTGTWIAIDIDTASVHNTITGNVIYNYTANGAGNGGGVMCRGNYNTVSGNTIYDMLNAGAGYGCGVYVDGNYNAITGNVLRANERGLFIDSGATQNKVSGNVFEGNTISIDDNGTDTDIVYYPKTPKQLQEAIDSIGAKSGTIHLGAATYNLTAPIDLDGGGSVVIEGEGILTVVDCNGDRSAFIVNSPNGSAHFRNFKIDAEDLTTSGVAIIDVDSALLTTCDGLWIKGDNTNGTGIDSDVRVHVINCRIQGVNIGVRSTDASGCQVINNYMINCNTAAVQTSGASSRRNTITGNLLNGGDHAVQLSGGRENTVVGNQITGGNSHGIYVLNSDDNCITGNVCTNAANYAIYLSGSDNCTISGNVCNGNNLFNASNGGGIGIDADSNYNTISGNTCHNNINAGAGTAYGINIINANCDDNFVGSNCAEGNDTDYNDSGTGTVDDSGDQAANDLNRFG